MGSSTTQTVGSLASAVPGVGQPKREPRRLGRGGEVEAAVDLSMSVEYGRIIHQIVEAVRTNVICGLRVWLV